MNGATLAEILERHERRSIRLSERAISVKQSGLGRNRLGSKNLVNQYDFGNRGSSRGVGQGGGSRLFGEFANHDEGQ